MRRFTVLLAGIALLVPLVAVPGGPASAVASSLKVRALDRDGRPTLAWASVTNLATHRVDFVGRQAFRLPAGRYDVVVDIFSDGDQSDTLGVRRVTVSGTTTVTVDARRGRQVRATLSPAAPSGYRQYLLMSLCDSVSPSPFAGFSGYTVSDKLYVIPSRLQSLELAYASIWAPTDPSDTGPRYLASAALRGGLPSDPARTFRQSTLARLDIAARSGPQSGRATIQLYGRSADECASQNLDLSTSFALPFSTSVYVSAGWWSISERGQDVISRPSTRYRAGHHYRMTLNRAAWGPGGELPYTRSGGRLYLNTAQLFADAEFRSGAGARVTYTLVKAGRMILRRTVSNEGATLASVLPGAGWYTLTASAARHPRHALAPGTLSTKSSLRLHFYANPGTSRQVRGYLTRFSPHGLDATNRAAAGSSTTVYLRVQRGKPADGSVRQLSDSVHRVRAWASTDGGHTWHRLRVRHTATGWSAVVHNPQSGYVSLRSAVTDTHGSTSTTQVIRAYAVR